MDSRDQPSYVADAEKYTYITYGIIYFNIFFLNFAIMEIYYTNHMAFVKYVRLAPRECKNLSLPFILIQIKLNILKF